jgi:hypothetical protein
MPCYGLKRRGCRRRKAAAEAEEEEKRSRSSSEYSSNSDTYASEKSEKSKGTLRKTITAHGEQVKGKGFRTKARRRRNGSKKRRLH